MSEFDASLSSSSHCGPRSAIQARLESFNDGHQPGSTKVGTQIAKYSGKYLKQGVTIFDDLLPAIWCDRVYDYAVKKSRPWGAYIPTAMARDSSIDAEQLWRSGDCEKAVALVTVRSLFLDRAADLIGPDIDAIHGTAVWCLASGITNEVQYHLDYAELYRYETNIIYPPVYAGTFQASQVHSEDDMRGGDFFANMSGLEHYARFGYKGRLASEADFHRDFATSSDWVKVPYRHNRASFCDGDLPHLASKVEHLRDNLKRVILGFNAFPAELAECCARAPEHSDAFNRTIKIYQALAAAGLPITAPTDETARCEESSDPQTKDRKPAKAATGISAKDIAKNPVLAKMLIAAARKEREKAKEREEPSSKS